MSRYAATITFVVFAVGVLSACNSSKSKPTEREMAAAEDEIYEAVVRHATTPVNGQPQITQLVFDDTLVTPLGPEGDLESCKRSTRETFRLEIGPPAYDSLADKAYRFFTRSDYDAPLHAETVQSFLERSCTSGRLSQTFHTDLPRTFMEPQKAHFKDYGPKSFGQLYPGARGIISFSHAGIDSRMNEAIVSVRFARRAHYETRYRYILRKTSGRWEVEDLLMVCCILE